MATTTSTSTSTFFFLLCLTLFLAPSHNTATSTATDSASGDTAETSDSKTVSNVVNPEVTSFIPRKTPPYFFHYYFHFPHYHFPLTRQHPYYGYSIPPFVPRPPPPPPPPPTETSSLTSPPPPIPDSKSLPLPSPIGNLGKQGSAVASPPPPMFGRTPQWPLHPWLHPWWSRPRFFATHPYLLHPKLQWPFHITNRPSMQNSKPPQQHP